MSGEARDAAAVDTTVDVATEEVKDEVADTATEASRDEVKN